MQYGLEDVAALLNCMTPEELKEYAVGKIRISEDTLKKILLNTSSEDKFDVYKKKKVSEKKYGPSPSIVMRSDTMEDLEPEPDQAEKPPLDEDKKLFRETTPDIFRTVTDESYKPSKKRTDKKTTTSDIALQKELTFLRLNNEQLKEENKKLIRKNRELKDKLGVFIAHISEVIIRHK
jgi:hypothetical protein